jgi:hypothetical protein
MTKTTAMKKRRNAIVRYVETNPDSRLVDIRANSRGVGEYSNANMWQILNGLVRDGYLVKCESGQYSHVDYRLKENHEALRRLVGAFLAGTKTLKDLREGVE